jgi:hypothetical protein
MRALGPGSVSSLLKTVLDVVYVALVIAAGALVLAAFVAALFRIDPVLLGDLQIDGVGPDVLARGPVVAAALTAGGLYVGGVLVIVNRLRKIFTTLTEGDPFQPDNVVRLRVIGLMLAGLEITHYVTWIGTAWLLPQLHGTEPSFSLSSWFSVLVVFVLAEVFREGARLRREAELTI